MRKYKVKINCIISVKLADNIKPCNFKKIIHSMIKEDLEEEYWKIEKLNIEKGEELNGKGINCNSN